MMPHKSEKKGSVLIFLKSEVLKSGLMNTHHSEDLPCSSLVTSLRTLGASSRSADVTANESHSQARRGTGVWRGGEVQT